MCTTQTTKPAIKVLTLEIITEELGLNDTLFNLEEKQIQNLFSNLSFHFTKALNALEEENIEKLIITLAEASSYFIRTLYPLCKDKPTLIEKYTNMLLFIRDYIFNSIDLKTKLQTKQLNFEKISLLYRISDYIYNKVEALTREDINESNCHCFTLYYIINGFTHVFGTLVNRYIDMKVDLKVESLENNGIEVDEQRRNEIDDAITKNICKDPLSASDIQKIDNLIFSHVLAQEIDKPLISDLTTKLVSINRRLECKKSIFAYFNKDINHKISQIQLLIGSLCVTKPQFNSFYSCLLRVINSEAINQHRSWFYKIPLLPYLLSCIPKIREKINEAPITKQKLSDIKNLLLMRQPAFAMGDGLCQMFNPAV